MKITIFKLLLINDYQTSCHLFTDKKVAIQQLVSNLEEQGYEGPDDDREAAENWWSEKQNKPEPPIDTITLEDDEVEIPNV